MNQRLSQHFFLVFSLAGHTHTKWDKLTCSTHSWISAEEWGVSHALLYSVFLSFSPSWLMTIKGGFYCGGQTGSLLQHRPRVMKGLNTHTPNVPHIKPSLVFRSVPYFGPTHTDRKHTEQWDVAVMIRAEQAVTVINKRSLCKQFDVMESETE